MPPVPRGAASISIACLQQIDCISSAFGPCEGYKADFVQSRCTWQSTFALIEVLICGEICGRNHNLIIESARLSQYISSRLMSRPSTPPPSRPTFSASSPSSHSIPPSPGRSVPPSPGRSRLDPSYADRLSTSPFRSPSNNHSPRASSSFSPRASYDSQRSLSSHSLRESQHGTSQSDHNAIYSDRYM